MPSKPTKTAKSTPKRSAKQAIKLPKLKGKLVNSKTGEPQFVETSLREAKASTPKRKS